MHLKDIDQYPVDGGSFSVHPEGEQTLRLMIFITMNLAVAVIALIAAIFLFAIGAQLTLSVGTLTYSCSSFVLHVFRDSIKKLKTKVTIYLTLWLSFATVMSMLSGGIHGPMAYIFLPIPIISLIFLSLRSTVVWSSFLIITYFGLYWQYHVFNVEELQNLIFISAATVALLTIGGIFQHLTERANRRTSEALRELKKFQAILVSSAKISSLGEMAAGIAHEINSPLASIKSISGQMQEVVQDNPIDRSLVNEMAVQIENTTDRIAEIVQGLRTFSREGKKDAFLRINLYQLLKGTLGLCVEKFKAHGIELRLGKFSREIYFEGRATEISQVLVNLLNNANDAIAELNKKWIGVEVIEHQSAIEIQITDSGNGISPEVQEKMFQPFFTTKEIGKGTGLGLSVSFRIIKRHGGEMRLDNDCPNTRFIIRLPKWQSQKVA